VAFIASKADFLDQVRSQINKGDLDSALRAIHRMVDQVVLEPVNTARIFGSKELDDLCQEVGRLRSEQLELPPPAPRPGAQKVNVYVASRLHASGGHTAAMGDIIRLGPAARSIVLLTGVGGPTDHAAVQHRFESIANIEFDYAPRGSHIDKLDWLMRKLRELAPADVWLFNHHQDSVAIAAVQPNAGYRLRYFHHGDHNLCLGVHLAYGDHIDTHPMGFHVCREQLGMATNRYLPLAAKDQGTRAASGRSPGQPLITCTAAGFNKIEVPYFINYTEVVPGLVKASGGRHLHIGPLSTSARRKIRSGLRKLGLPESAFVYLPYVPSVWNAMHQYQVDFYVASFPYGGARTLLEVMGAGIPVAAHSHCASRLLGGFDMAYEGALIWREPEQLYDYVKKLQPADLAAQAILARRRYEQFHSEAALRQALADDAAPLQSPPLIGAYAPDHLQQGLDISLQANLSGALRRFTARFIRRMRWMVDNFRPY
jgi:hypothetical protein